MNETWLNENPNWQETDHLAIYKRGRRFEHGATQIQVVVSEPKNVITTCANFGHAPGRKFEKKSEYFVPGKQKRTK